MTHREGPGPGAPVTTVDSFLEAKLHWPSPRPHWLCRQRLLARMRSACEHPVTLVAAPAGYGKTIMVAQWLEQARPCAAWVSLDPGDNDANRFWSHVAAALERAGCHVESRRPAHRVTDEATAPGSMLSVITSALAGLDHDIVVVLDDFHFVRSAACHAQVEMLIEHLPPQAHLVLLTRADPGLRLGRLRASGGLLEIRADALGFTPEEAGALLAQERVELGADAMRLLLTRTEGWPAGLYLALLSLAGRPDPDAFVRDFSGGHRYIGDYLTEEVLSRHPDHLREFIKTMSILDRFCAPLCDHVAGSDGSAGLLHELERTNLFLVPLDEDGRWFRFHHLFAAVARSELGLRRPEDVRLLHARAAEWFVARGNVDEGVRHSLAAGQVETASTLVQAHWLQFVDAGRIATVLGWLEAVGPPTEATDPAASVTAAWVAALIGDEAELGSRLEALRAFGSYGPLPDGARSVESAVAMIDGLFGYGGPLPMMRGAEAAVALETDRHSPFYALAQVTLGHAAYVAGDLDRAVVPLSNAWRNDRGPVVVRALALATGSLVEDEQGHAARARASAETAMELLEANGLGAMPQASLAFTALGLAYAGAGFVDRALVTLDRGLVLRRETSAHGPWGMIHHLVVHAGVAARAGRTELARDLLGDLDSRLERYTVGMGAVRARVDAVRRLVHDDAPAVLPEELTAREVDILRLLQGSLSLHEIGDALYLSANTVKTHTRAVYRKLGVHTRTDAVVAGRRAGLL